ncbi:carboxylating nicotinate-nucleotide diphosphorylase [Candidatus Vondammii sp. HM_W22]|uniref:carboxylating nicotinate-nucleotide diphosphorylase n=1 Tax=Candidatus Vondammii sp. HM_W22 TaxID=2687299 RepID=UPI001F129027|nr:carboxylating nicotinate-nucleotide diphosphorylase [Candidatus Vondammii sp. HM_W22]
MPSADLIKAQVRLALDEDIGSGDRTADLISEGALSRVEVVCRERALLCGTVWFDEVFRQLAPGVDILWLAADGDWVDTGRAVCELHGDTRALLSGERTSLNYLQTLSGTATLAHCYADIVAGTGVRILDTRKTLPGLRVQQKYAVLCGGCDNHRIGLYDAILLKENHIRAAGSVSIAVRAALASASDIEVKVEVESLAQLSEAINAGARRILLDNFSLEQLREAAVFAGGKARLEASGGVNMDTIRAIAETGVDDISVGALTKDVTAIDFSMLFID